MNPFLTLSAIKKRATEAVIAQSGLSHSGLKNELRSLFNGESSSEGRLVQEPVIESAHPFVTADVTMGKVPNNVLHPKFIEALDALDPRSDYRFPASRKPYTHQLQAWTTLSTNGNPQSVLVTSGTGSGKTECFLFPILSDLVKQVSRTDRVLEGVQAIMLYPLNALIESQRERLSAWTAPFEGKIRYCLYNGDLPKDAQKESDRRRTPEQLIDRKQLRASPPPVLVTNITMLEYMLSRAEDQPIIEKSKQTLKWIVLDEAHSLVGAAAAEIALLLRRVLSAFETSPEDVHFVATSATIGSGENLRQQLQRFLAEVAGIRDANVHVIEGHRQFPQKPIRQHKTPIPEDVENADPELLYEQLGAESDVWRFIERLFETAIPFRELNSLGARFGMDGESFLTALSRAARKSPETGAVEHLAPVRIHSFERAVPGIWGCINPECKGRPPEWPFGRVLTEHADFCPDCGAPTLEIINCAECGEPFLEGEERGNELSSIAKGKVRDEFAFEAIRDSDTDEFDDDLADIEDDKFVVAHTRLFAATPTASARPFWLEKDTWKVLDSETANTIKLRCDERQPDGGCPCCGKKPRGDNQGILRSIRFGAPFMISNAAPILLEGVDPVEENSQSLPSGGRRLLSFTDSRQGTARMSAKIQAESERNFVRSFVYHSMQQSMQATSGDPEKIALLKETISQLEKIQPNPVIETLLRKHKAELQSFVSLNSDGLLWDELVDRLSRRQEVEIWITDVWQPRDPELFSDPRKLAEFLLLREFDRRPKRANSLETLGMARLRLPSIDLISILPSAFARRGKTLEDWKAFLYTVVLHFIRGNGAIETSRPIQHWLMPKAKLRSLLGPDQSSFGDRRYISWPNAKPKNRRSLPEILLARGLNLKLDDSEDRADIEECLYKAWQSIQPVLSTDPERRVFDFRKSAIAPLERAYFCPITRRIVDNAPFGFTPYCGLNDPEGISTARALVMPTHPAPSLGVPGQKETDDVKAKWLETDSIISKLRELGTWTNISDRIALFADYSRSAEHSAQQNSKRLRRYEAAFKEGRINILNCSTTMEMGVDIGSVSTVMMTNVPPSIANYRQRVGRAGRRNQAMSLAFTYCKDKPLDREAFQNPAEYLKRSLSAPHVALSSRPIVQRHVNAYLLRAFIVGQGGDAIKMMLGPFLGCPSTVGEKRQALNERPIEMFRDWLLRPTTKEKHKAEIVKLVNQSVLEGEANIIDDTLAALQTLENNFVGEWEGLQTLAKEEGLKEAGKTRMGLELKRLCEEFLLSGLADRGFLPGHGFPTNVVSFIPGGEAKERSEGSPDGNRQYRNLGPQRSLDLAIRDYAPGSEVVLDGLVHRSAGVTLNWKRPASEENITEVQSLKHHWHCESCGTSDTGRGKSPTACVACGSTRITYDEYLRPGGFSVDFREKPHADTDQITYVAPQDPIVSTRNAPWQSLPIPDIGRFRSTREGLVFYSNKGPFGEGYSLCLHCGRAAADRGDEDSATPVSAPLANHQPLRWRRGEQSDVCPGNDSPWKIRSNLTLGHEISTDVFELQPSVPLNRASATALVISIREALAQDLGIEADEMGFSVKETKGRLGKPSASMLLFDRAAGGGGFAVSLDERLTQTLKRAELILDCATPGCKTACAACVLTSDAPDGDDALDRIGALSFVQQHLAFPDEIPLNQRFVSDATLSLSTVDEIDRCLRSGVGARLLIFFPDRFDAGQLHDWVTAKQFSSWTHRGYPVDVVLTSNAISALDDASKLSLRDFLLQHDLRLLEGPCPETPNDTRVFAVVQSNNKNTAWASQEEVSTQPGSFWATPVEEVIATGSAPTLGRFSEVDKKLLLPSVGATFRKIADELDVDIRDFGRCMSAQIKQLLHECGAPPSSEIVQILYRDPYVSSPLVAKLLIDTIHELLKGNAAAARIDLETRKPKQSEYRREAWQVTHDWQDPDDHKLVVEGYSRRKGLKVSLTHTMVPHGRYMEISFTAKRSITVVFDQGFGAWSIPYGLSVKYDFKAPASKQVDALLLVPAVVKRNGVGPTYVVAARS